MTPERVLRTKSAQKRLTSCLVAASLCLVLNGCEQSAKTRQVIDQRAAEAQQSLGNARPKQSQATSYDPLTVSSKVWGGSAALRMQRGMPLPARFEVPRGVTIVSSESMSLSDIANAISAQTGIPVRLSALTMGSNAAASSASASSTASATTASPTIAVASNSSLSSNEMPMSYEGPLSGLLDRVSAYFGTSWRFDGSSISVSRFETRIFVVEAMPGTHEINEGMQDDVSSSNGSSGGSSSGGSSGGSSSSSSTGAQNTLTQNSKTVINLKYWDELAEVLKNIVSGQGSVVTSPTMGTVTVTATPDVMATISDYLSKENKRLSRQIAINVQIYSVNLQQSEDFNLAMKGFIDHFTQLAGAPGIASSGLSASDFGSVGIAVLPGTNGQGGANTVFSALSAIGDTTQVAQFPMTTLNNRPVSRRVGTDTSYIQSVTQNTTTSTSSTTILTPIIATVHDGFSLQLTPRLLDDGRILLQYSLSLIGLDTLGATTFQNQPLDLPITDNRVFVQQSMLRSGQTLVIGGVDQERLTQNKRGVGSPDNFLLGGGVSSSNAHLMMFMAITPQVMDMQGEERN